MKKTTIPLAALAFVAIIMAGWPQRESQIAWIAFGCCLLAACAAWWWDARSFAIADHLVICAGGFAGLAVVYFDPQGSLGNAGACYVAFGLTLAAATAIEVRSRTLVPSRDWMVYALAAGGAAFSMILAGVAPAFWAEPSSWIGMSLVVLVICVGLQSVLRGPRSRWQRARLSASK